eukprot:g3988.t1
MEATASTGAPYEDFPWIDINTGPFHSRFCDNFEQFITTAGMEFYSKPSNISRAWNLPLRYHQSQITLKVYEEGIELGRANCEQCRCNGWQHHPVSRTKIHFIFPSRNSEFVIESKLHVLHGVIHLNGFGHLLRVNGLEGGSEYLRGTQLMQFWDAICQLLRVREITVEDVSNRKGMQLRVLLPIARRTTFYMKHGYEFGRGQFGVKQSDWIQAVNYLNQTSLQDLLVDFLGVDETIQRIILRYQGQGEDKPMTLGALLDSMLILTENEYCALQFCLHLLSRQEPSSDELRSCLPPVSTPPINGLHLNGSYHEDTDTSQVMDISPTGGGGGGDSSIQGFNQVEARQSLSGKITPSQSSVGLLQEGEESDGSQVNTQMDETQILKVPRKYKKRIPLDDPGDLIKPQIAPFNAATLFEGSRKYSATKMIEIIRITLGVLQSYENRWVRLQELRDILYDTAHDRVLADFVLGRMANSIVNGFSIFKQRSKIARCNYYLFEKYNGVDRNRCKESFISQIEEQGGLMDSSGGTPLPSPGPELVNGHSLARFEDYLGLLFKWMCNQPNVSIGRGPNKNKPKPKSKRKEPPDQDFLNSMGHSWGKGSSTRLTRASSSNVMKQSKLSEENYRRIQEPWLERYPSDVAPTLECFRTNGPQPGARFSARQNVLVDLLYFYQSVIESYTPLTDGHKSQNNLRLTDFAKNIQILKDTKFFIRRYPMHEPGSPNTHRLESEIPLVCQVLLDPTIPPGHLNERMRDEMPSFLSTPPPPEEIRVPVGSTVVAIKHAVEESFSQIYSMFELWSVGALAKLKLENQVLESMPSGLIVEVKGKILRNELELRHSGGVEDWEVICPCGTRDDDGARMLCCDMCGIWMHTRCAGFRDDTSVPSFFQCPHCYEKQNLQ